MHGAFEEGERHATEAWRYGEHAHGENATQVYLFDMLNVRRELGGLEDLLIGMEGFVEASPLPAWRSGLALAYAELGREGEALAQVESFARDGFDTVPRDAVWFATMGMLTLAVGRFDATAYAGPLYELLAPFQDRNCVVGGAIYCFGPVPYLLGILARPGRARPRARAAGGRAGAMPRPRRSAAARARAGGDGSHAPRASGCWGCRTCRIVAR